MARYSTTKRGKKRNGQHQARQQTRGNHEESRRERRVGARRCQQRHGQPADPHGQAWPLVRRSPQAPRARRSSQKVTSATPSSTTPRQPAKGWFLFTSFNHLLKG